LARGGATSEAGRLWPFRLPAPPLPLSGLRAGELRAPAGQSKGVVVREVANNCVRSFRIGSALGLIRQRRPRLPVLHRSGRGLFPTALFGRKFR